MAEDVDQESKTEPASPQRREEARRQGQVAFSPELTGNLLLLTGVILLLVRGPTMGQDLLGVIRYRLRWAYFPQFGVEQAADVLNGMALRGLDIIGLFLGMAVTVALAVNVFQVGFVISPAVLAFRPERLNPATGWSRVFSVAGVVRGLLAVVKVLVVGLMAFVMLRGRIGLIATLDQVTVAESAATTWTVAIRLALMVAAALAILGVVDYVYQRFRFERQLRMTKQEAKEEAKREEGDPVIKGRIRRMAREMAQRRMMREVPRATVVITNPEHLAVALRYERGKMPAPRVVAKGAGLMARRIVDLARRHGVPVLERKEVAQALYRRAEVGRDIPVALFVLVAEVLAYLYRLQGTAWQGVRS
jgi:flagellar biosynthetic protein FlhB